jgi:hypothetical protein
LQVLKLKNVKKVLTGIILFFGFIYSIPSFAVHIIGGEVTYIFLDSAGTNPLKKYRYRITFKMYIDTNYDTQPRVLNIDWAIYNKDNNLKIQGYTTPTGPVANITPVLPAGCIIPTFSKKISLHTYEFVVELPRTEKGYVVFFESSNRFAINNIDNAPMYGNTFEAHIPSPVISNSSPQFKELAVPYLCVNDTATFLNNAFDPDGDSLVYEFVSPFNGVYQQPPASYKAPGIIQFKSGNPLKPFGDLGFAEIDRETGGTTYLIKQSGVFAVVLEIKEYRKIDTAFVFLGSVRRELLLHVGDCPLNKPPLISTTNNVTVFEMMPGENLCFSVKAQDPENNVLSITASGDILDGTNNYTGPKATFIQNSATGSVTGEFCWQTSCDTKPGNYFVTIKAKDMGCPPKQSSFIYIIRLSALPKPAINGSKSVCPGVSGVEYSSNLKSNYAHQWYVNGSAPSSGSNSTKIIVDWKTPGLGTVSLNSITDAGCKLDSTGVLIKIKKVLEPEVAQGEDTVCRNSDSNLKYSISYAPGSVYDWKIKGGKITGVSSTGTMITVDWDTVGKGMLWYLESSVTPDEVCAGTSDTLTVSNFINPEPELSGISKLCELSEGKIYNAAGFPGSKYDWTVSGGKIKKGQGSASITVDWSKAGNFSVSVIETAAMGCLSDNVFLPVVLYPVPTMDVSNIKTLLCPQNMNNALHRVVGLVGTQFQWTITNGDIISGQGNDSLYVKWNGQPGTINVKPHFDFACYGNNYQVPVNFDFSEVKINYVTIDPSWK